MFVFLIISNGYIWMFASTAQGVYEYNKEYVKKLYWFGMYFVQKRNAVMLLERRTDFVLQYECTSHNNFHR